MERGFLLAEFCSAIGSCVRQQVYSAIMSLQPFWRLSGLRALLTSATNQLRTFSSSHAAKGCSLDPVKRRAQMDRHNEIKRLRRQSDPDWLRRERQTVRNSVRRAKWRETNRETVLEYLREFCKQRYAHDPRHKLRKRMHDLAMAHAWFREKLPWKSHVPIRYDEKVQHSCEKCIVTRFGGFKLW